MIIESREPKHIIDKIREKSKDSTVEFFEVGDYHLPDDYLIERKRGLDFLASVLDKRIYEQLNNLNQASHPIIAIITENIWRDFYYSRSNYIYNVYLGTLTTIISSYPKVRIIQFEKDDDFIDFLISLEKKLLDEGKSERPKPHMRRVETMAQRQENCLCAIQGVGVPISKRLLTHYKSIKELCNATEDDLQTLEKVGKTLAHNIVETLNEKYEK
jgi:Fanconi anemia group M protein